jgi:hypothetical protein
MPNDKAREYEKIEASIKRLIRMGGNEDGVLTDYVILETTQFIDPQGEMVTMTGWHTNPKNGIPYHRMIGLLEYVKALMLKDAIDTEEL